MPWYSGAMKRLVVYWSRRDFRLEDNPALSAAIEESRAEKVPLCPVFVAEDYMLRGSPGCQFGLPSRIFLGRAVPAFAERFPFFLLAYGVAPDVITRIAQTYGAAVHVNEDVHPDFYAQIAHLRACGVTVKVYEDQLTIPKDTMTQSGNRYSVFTPFKNAVWQHFVTTSPAALAHPGHAHPVQPGMAGELIVAYSRASNDPAALQAGFSRDRRFAYGSRILDLAHDMPEPDLDGWYASEKDALARFERFLEGGGMDSYAHGRDLLGDEDGTSRMSLALTWGLVSARMLVARLRERYETSFEKIATSAVRQSAAAYIVELVWREFYKYLFYHDPSLMQREFQEKYRGTVAWEPEEEASRRFAAWVRGETGYELVDAAMHQLAKTGYMHNRARMVVASVLTKNLGVDWRWGQEYFRAALIDLDESSNNGGWQWGASVGADPKPIRIFNPDLQAARFDPERAYRDRWLPEGYCPEPIVPQPQARAAALARYGLGSPR